MIWVWVQIRRKMLGSASFLPSSVGVSWSVMCGECQKTCSNNACGGRWLADLSVSVTHSLTPTALGFHFQSFIVSVAQKPPLTCHLPPLFLLRHNTTPRHRNGDVPKIQWRLQWPRGQPTATRGATSHTRAKSRDHGIVRAPKKVSKGHRPNDTSNIM
jgi:hypothetical protein